MRIHKKMCSILAALALGLSLALVAMPASAGSCQCGPPQIRVQFYPDGSFSVSGTNTQFVAFRGDAHAIHFHVTKGATGFLTNVRVDEQNTTTDQEAVKTSTAEERGYVERPDRGYVMTSLTFDPYILVTG